jgi:ADP-ribosylglycohydrolase
MAEALQRMYAQLAAARHKLSTRLQDDDCFPDRTAVSVPLAISLALVTKSASKTILLATNIGGDTDSVASIGGALAATMYPQSVNDGWYQAVEQLNKHHLVEMAAKLAALRQ